MATESISKAVMQDCLYSTIKISLSWIRINCFISVLPNSKDNLESKRSQYVVLLQYML